MGGHSLIEEQKRHVVEALETVEKGLAGETAATWSTS